MRTALIGMVAILSAGYWLAAAPLHCAEFRVAVSSEPPYKVECVENPVLAFLWSVRHR